MIQPFLTVAMWTAVHGAATLPLPTVERPLPLQDAAVATAAPAPKWTGSVTFGGLVTTGNSETRNANAVADAEYRREKDRFSLGFLWTYAQEKNTTADWLLTDRRTGGRAKYDYFLSEKTYLLAQASAENDYQADLELRTTIGVGAGRQFLEDDTWKLSAEAGVSSVDESYYSSSDNNYIAARVSLKADWNYSKRWTFSELLTVLPSLESTDDVNAHSELGAKLTLTENMLAQLMWTCDYDNTPAAGKDRVDQRYLITVGWKF